MFSSNKRPGLYFYYLFLIAGMVFIYTTSHAESFLIISSFRNNFLDTIMPWITFMGDGLFALMVAVVFIIYRLRYGIYLSLSFIVSGIIVQVMKRLIFIDELRPVAYFKELGIDIPVVPAYETALMYSFPSGHTTTAFACFVGISFLVKKWYLKLLLLLIAIIVGYSRIYLAVHFPVDVIAGSLIGVLTAYIFYIWVFNWEKTWLDVSLGQKFIKAISS